jgi:hypothetical protein
VGILIYINVIKKVRLVILFTGNDIVIQFASYIVQLYAYIVIILHNLLFIWTAMPLNVLYVHS